MRTHGGAEIEGFISLEQMSAERFIRIKSSIGHDAPENLLLKAGLQLQTGIIGTRVASVPGVVMNSELLGIIPSAVVESLGWSDRIQILPNPTSAEPMEVSLMSRVKQRRTRPQRCCCKQEFRITNYLLVRSATLVPDPPFSSKTRVCNSTAASHSLHASSFVSCRFSWMEGATLRGKYSLPLLHTKFHQVLHAH